MGVKTFTKWREEENVPGEELDFDVLHEAWNEYKTEDGTVLKLKTVVSKIARLERYTSGGDPVYIISSANIVTAMVQPELKEKKK